MNVSQTMNVTKADLRVLLVSDSRGFDLSRILDRCNLRNFVVENRSVSILSLDICGGDINKLAKSTYAYLGRSMETFDLVYLLGGINNLTVYKGKRFSEPIYWCAGDMVRDLCIALYGARTLIKKRCNKVVLGELIGFSLEIYNTFGDQFQYQQDIINKGVIKLNQYVMDANNKEKVFTPHIANRVHRVRKDYHTISHLYATLLRDGLHYNEKCANYIVRLLITNIKANLKRSTTSEIN